MPARLAVGNPEQVRGTATAALAAGLAEGEGYVADQFVAADLPWFGDVDLPARQPASGPGAG